MKKLILLLSILSVVLMAQMPVITYKGWRGDNYSVPGKLYVGDSTVVEVLSTDTVITNIVKSASGNLKLSGAGAGYVEVTDTLSPATYFTPYQQTVSVAKAGADYTLIQSAINSISDAASDKIYTVLVYPGEYDEEITLKNYVNIVSVDPFSTYILRQVTDNGVAVHCNLKINIDNRQTDGSSGLNLDAASVVNIVGNVTGGVGDNGHGIYNNSTGTVIVNGNVTGGDGHGIYNNSAGTVIVNGNVTGGDGHGIYNYDTGTVIVNGNVTGGDGHGISNYDTGTVIVNGNVTGGGEAYCGIFNASTGMVRVKNGTISNIGTTATSYPIFIYQNNSLILENCKIIGVHVDVPAISSIAPAHVALNVYLMNVYSNRDLHSNITNLISGGFTYDSDVPSP